MRGKVPFRPWATSFFDIGGGWLAVKRCGRIAVADYSKAGAGVGAKVGVGRGSPHSLRQRNLNSENCCTIVEASVLN